LNRPNVIADSRFHRRRNAQGRPHYRDASEMKKELFLAKSPLPKFLSDQEAAEYFESHSIGGVWDRLSEALRAKPSAALAGKIRDRRAGTKRQFPFGWLPNRSPRPSTSQRGSRLATKHSFECGLPREYGAKRPCLVSRASQSPSRGQTRQVSAVSGVYAGLPTSAIRAFIRPSDKSTLRKGRIMQRQQRALLDGRRARPVLVRSRTPSSTGSAPSGN